MNMQQFLMTALVVAGALIIYDQFVKDLLPKIE